MCVVSAVFVGVVGMQEKLTSIYDCFGQIGERLFALQMELLDVSGNKFGNNGAFAFTKCLDKVSKLVMENCAVTKNGFLRFKQAYETFPEKVFFLSC